MKYRYFEIGKKPRMIESKHPLTLEELQKLVGGMIEFTPLHNGNTLCVNEEGVIMQLPYNRAFTEKDTPADISFGLRGNIVEGKVREEDGEFVGVEL